MPEVREQTLHTSVVGTSLPARHSVPKLGFFDTLGVLGDVLLPAIAKGPIVRRRTMLAVAEFFDLDRRAIRRMQRVRNTHGPGPQMLKIPGRRLALILDPADVHRVLDGTPEPFATSTPEKRAALAHFEPKGALISHKPERQERRRYNEEALQSDSPVHQLSHAFLNIVATEAQRIHSHAHRRGELTWDVFAEGWFRVVRRVIFGDIAQDDHELSTMMAELRSAGNWAFLARSRRDVRERMLGRIRTYLRRAEPHSLAGFMSRIHSDAATAPEHQVPQWLFAFDPAGMTTFRSLALLATHPAHAWRARNEIAQTRQEGRPYMPYLRATILESLRLWPTTPLVLRETTTDTTWQNGVLPADMGIIVYAPFFHRDNQRLPYADRFSPELWQDDLHAAASPQRSAQGWPLIPFSDGPAICPGRHLVLMLTSAMLAELFDRSDLRLKSHPRFGDHRPLPATLNHFALRFAMR
jgi:cytochrome P450